MLDEEVVSTSKSESVYTNTVSVLVRSDVDQETSIQLWPCVHVPSGLHIPQAVKDIYSRLAQAASEIDQGMPQMVLSLVGTGNAFGNETNNKLHQGLKRLIGHCGLWLVTSGEFDDPMARVLAQTLRSALSQMEDPSETLVIVANSQRAIHKASHSFAPNAQLEMVDTRYNTLYVLLKDAEATEDEELAFRCRLAMKLASPPPALLIGVPDDRMTVYGTAAQTPISSSAPAIILPNSLQACERKPMPITLFCGASLRSLKELSEYIECGVPVIVVQDVSELCAVLRNSLILYKSAGFDHDSFVQWLDNELRSICDNELLDGGDTESLVQVARQEILRILAAGVGPDHSLIAFIPVDAIQELPEHILELFMEYMNDSHAYPQLLELALRLNSPSVVRQLSVGDLRRETVSSILEQVLANERSIHVLSALLDQKVPLTLTADLLYKWFENTFDKYFFQAIIMGSLLGYTERPDQLDERLANDINNLLRHLSGGIRDLFPPHVLFMPMNERRQDQAQTLQIMAVWAMLMNQLELVKCLCAYAPEPLGLSIVLAKVARSLAYESHEWFFFEQRLYALSDYLCQSAHRLLSDAFDESPIKAYKALCYKSEIFNQLTVPQLAYETTTRVIIAHECCQRWVLRLLYGNLQLVTLSRHIRLSNWLKIVICALFVIPIRWWISRRPPAIHRRRGGQGMRRAASPTVAMLEMGRQPKRTVGAFSTYSAQSGRSTYLRDDFLLGQSTREATPFDMHHANQLDEPIHDNGSAWKNHQPETPQSAMSAANPTAGTLDDVESSLLYGQMLETRFYRPSMSPQPKKSKGISGRRKAGFRDLVMFYSTPIVKYWLSLVFRLGYLALLAFTLILPSCIDDYLELSVWIWSLMWLIEAAWVLSIRLQTSSAGEMKWRIFDLCFVTVYLLGMITFRVSAARFWQTSFPKQSYVLKIAWTYFLIYQCYATLFIYIPMSNMLGPFMVRVKLMITRDFFYFSILISLVVASTLVAIKAVVYPDLHPTYQVGANIFGWTWLSLFTTDLSEMKESQECKRFVFLEDHRIQCKAIGGYSNPWCATQGPAATITVYQFLVVLKLISWPILFALFARTAKEVDEEADQIWKYQLYSLAVDFSLRPFLPPPFTFVFFLCALCRRMTGCIADLFGQITKMATDHPDARVPHSSPSLGANSNVYQNPSIPPSRPDVQRAFWGAAAVRQWKQNHPDKQSSTTHSAMDRRLGEKLQLLVITQSFRQSAKQKEPKAWTRVNGERRLKVGANARDWTLLIPDYRPREFSVECAELPPEAQRCVDDNLAELSKHWRNQKLQWYISGDPKAQRLLNADGLPLNPFGRTGLRGRNSYARYGANTLFFYVVFVTNEQGKVQVLVNSSTGALPSKWKHGALRPDEYLSEILTKLRVPDADIQRFSTRSHMPIGQVDTNIAHVSICPLPTPLQDTDNAWTEADLWAVCLNRTNTAKVDEFTWKFLDKLGTLPEGQFEFVQNAAQLFKLQ